MSGQGNRGRARAGRRAFGSPAGPRPCRQALPPGSTVDAHHAAPAWPCPPAWWVGRGLATRPRAVTPGDPPADAPARGDQHPARIGVRQGPQMHLLADAWRRPSLHPADLRLALPGVPRPRPAVLQPRRPAVPGARHRAAGGGAGPAVVGQGDGQAPHCAGRGVAMAVTAGRRRRREQLGWRHAARLTVMDLLPGPAGPPRRWRWVAADPLRWVIWFGPTPTGGRANSPRIALDVEARRCCAPVGPAQGALLDPPARRRGAGVRSPHPPARGESLRGRGAGR
jgi:hypothetical protein